MDDIVHEGGCLCGALRYAAQGTPLCVDLCHCRFCQRATGGAFLIEPIFAREALRFTGGTPALYDHRSAGSGKMIHVHFCRICGTKLAQTFERLPDVIGVHGGTFDDPDRFDISGASARYIVLGAGRHGVATHLDRPETYDGTPNTPTVRSEPFVIGP